MKYTFSVIGLGAGGILMSILLKDKGYTVRAMDKDSAKASILRDLDNWVVSGKTEACGKPDLVTTDAEECIRGADFIMICTTTDAHGDVASAISDTITSSQTIILNPGHVGGVLNFRNALKKAGCREYPVICEAADLMFACRVVEPGRVFHSGVKTKISLASIPAQNAFLTAERLKDIFQCYVPVDNVWMTSLSGMGGLLHSIPCTLNLNKIELKQQFEYYIEGLTPGICHVIEKADMERIAVGRALGIELKPLLDHLKAVYNLAPDTLYDAVQSCNPYKGIKSPLSTAHRFIQEDTLCDLVPTASIGHALGVPTPTIDMIIELESIMLEKDFRTEGRTAEKLGIEGKTADQIMQMVL